MKLTPEQIAKIERLTTTIEELGHRAAIIEFGLRDTTVASSFISVLRSLGVEIVTHPGKFAMSGRDRKEFLQWLRERRRTKS